MKHNHNTTGNTDRMEGIKRHRCVSCHYLFTEEHISFEPDPYRSEIDGDETLVWECEACREKSAMEI